MGNLISFTGIFQEGDCFPKIKESIILYQQIVQPGMDPALSVKW